MNISHLITAISSIVAVNGLDGDRTKSWTDEKTGICWLKHPDILPFAIPSARILTFGYDANTECTSSATLTEHADSLLEGLLRKRRGAEVGLLERPTYRQLELRKHRYKTVQ